MQDREVMQDSSDLFIEQPSRILMLEDIIKPRVFFSEVLTIKGIVQYGDILKVIIKPLDKTPQCFFFCNAEDIDIVQSYCWYLNNIYQTFCDIYSSKSFPKIVTSKHVGYYPFMVSHKNGIFYDNTNDNLCTIVKYQDSVVRPNRGYGLDRRHKTFKPKIRLNRETLYPYGVVDNELDACRLQHLVETDFVKSEMGSDYYIYDFLKDRREEHETVYLERTGALPQEEGTYRHVLKYADNAWYYYRYGLEDYFRQYHIPIPEFELNDLGFMCDKYTGRLLCPYK